MLAGRHCAAELLGLGARAIGTRSHAVRLLPRCLLITRSRMQHSKTHVKVGGEILALAAGGSQHQLPQVGAPLMLLVRWRPLDEMPVP